MILEGKTVIVVGVGPGLGGEIARLALRDGANVMIGARREAALQQSAKRLDPSGERLAWHAVDVVDASACQAIADATAERFGGVDALVQVAAVDAVFGGFDEASVEDFRTAFEVNVVGAAQMSRAVVPQLRARGGGSIVLIGSQTMFKPAVAQMAYAASKGALFAAMFQMVRDLGPDRIRVNTVVPTWMWGPPVERYVATAAAERGVSTQEIVAEIVSDMPIPEIPHDEDVAESVVFLCSDRARYVTGQTLFVNSGQHMR
ncbi:MAG: SDR family oxidoreductase [Deltaproteobacteria bacterium]|nr:SDR family oxidoreductase [Deltaproteobacteria bacterium]MBW2362336.1 SDR family oxidoreductase [Deltaproteobacteria bacterium]